MQEEAAECIAEVGTEEMVEAVAEVGLASQTGLVPEVAFVPEVELVVGTAWKPADFHRFVAELLAELEQTAGLEECTGLEGESESLEQVELVG